MRLFYLFLASASWFELLLVGHSTEVCPAPSPSTCPAFYSDTSWRNAQFSPCEDAVNFFTRDPWSESILHSCGTEHKSLIQSSCTDAIARDMAVDEVNNFIFLSTNYGIKRAHLILEEPARSADTNLEDFITGFTTVHLKGFNLGESREQVLSFMVKDVECGTLVYHNASDLTCVVGNPSVLSSSINEYCISLETVNGGRLAGAALVAPEVVAVARNQSGSRKPVVYQVEVSENGGFLPGALAVDGHRDRLFWSNRGSGTIQSARLDGSGMIQHVSGQLRVADMALSGDGRRLFYTECDRGALMVLHVNPDDPDYGAVLAKRNGIELVEEVAGGLREPWGLALDELNGHIFIAESGTGKLLRAEISDLFSSTSDRSGSRRLLKFVTITQSGSSEQLTEMALLPPRNYSSEAYAATVATGGPPEKSKLGENLQILSSETPPTEGQKSIAVDATSTIAASAGTLRPSTFQSTAFVPTAMDLSLRLFWVQTNAGRVSQSTIHGTHRRDLESVPSWGSGISEPLMWPCSIVADTRPEKAVVYVAEFLGGRVW